MKLVLFVQTENFIGCSAELVPQFKTFLQTYLNRQAFTLCLLYFGFSLCFILSCFVFALEFPDFMQFIFVLFRN